MTLKYNYNMLFREFQFFSSDMSDDWSTTRQNYAVSDYGNKIAVADINNGKLYIVSSYTTDGVSALISAIKDQAILNSVNNTYIKGQIGTKPVYYETIDLNKDPLYQYALGLDQGLNDNAGNFASWLTALANASTSYLTTLTTNNQKSVDTFIPFLFSNDARAHLSSAYSGTVQKDHFLVTNYDVSLVKASQTVGFDGGSGGRDVISIADSLESRLTGTMSGISSATSLTIGIWANISENNYSTSYNTSAGKTVSVSIAAGKMKFTAKESDIITAPSVDVSISLSNIDSLVGTKFDDVLVGNTRTNYFEPGAGNDIVMGNSNPATFHTGDLTYKDRVAYWDVPGAKGIIASVSCELNLSQTKIPVITVKDPSGGNDKLYNISYVVGSIYDDTFTGLAWDATSNPFRTEFAGLSGNDTVVGNGSTRVSYLYDPKGVSVNLSNVAVKNLDGTLLSAGKALDGFGGTDTLTSVFGIRGSDYADFINLSNSSEVATGSGGDDLIFGNGGNDNLWGNAGNDTIIGGTGIDIMVGRDYKYVIASDTLPAEDIDTFKFTSISDSSSTAIKATITSTSVQAAVGDIILDFDPNNDILDLVGIDANAKIKGNQAFKINTGSIAESKFAGHLTYQDASLTLSSSNSNSNYHQFASDFYKSSSIPSYTQTGVLVQGDIQGDGKADFSIFLVGVSESTIQSTGTYCFHL